jgi:hypothetical protein
MKPTARRSGVAHDRAVGVVELVDDEVKLHGLADSLQRRLPGIGSTRGAECEPLPAGVVHQRSDDRHAVVAVEQQKRRVQCGFRALE